jgi:hypothetical protein
MFSGFPILAGKVTCPNSVEQNGNAGIKQREDSNRDILDKNW